MYGSMLLACALAQSTSTLNLYDPFGDSSGDALYKLDGNVLDESTLHNGTATDITYDVGVFDQGAVFNGSSSFINTNFKPNLSTFTVSFWVKQNAITGLAQGLCSTITNTGTDRLGFNIYTAATTGIISAVVYRSTGAVTLSTTIPITTATATHIVFTYSGGTCKIYIDKVLKVTSTVLITGFFSNLMFGRYYGSVIANMFSGTQDHIRVFHKQLSDSEVIQIYNEEL